MDLSVSEFLRTFQLHVFEHGMPEKVFSDLGSQLVAGGHILTYLINNVEVQLMLEENNVKPTKFFFYQFFKGHKPLGSLVESCVKLAKKLIHGYIRNTVLSLIKFEFIIMQTVSLVNKRPVAFKQSVRTDITNDTEVPAPITPEMLLKGHNLLTMNIVTEREESCWEPGSDYDPVEHEKSKFYKLSGVRKKPVDAYHDEFISTLVSQAVNFKDRFKPVMHKSFEKGDLVPIR